MLAVTRSLLVAGFTALVLPSAEPARAQSATPVGSIPVSKAAPSQSPAPSPLPSSRTIDSVAIALSAQLSEMRRSEDRLLSTVQWTLGAIVTVALGLAVFGWWSGTHVYKRDLDALREGSRKAVDAALTELRTSVAKTLQESVALARQENEG